MLSASVSPLDWASFRDIIFSFNLSIRKFSGPWRSAERTYAEQHTGTLLCAVRKSPFHMRSPLNDFDIGNVMR